MPRHLFRPLALVIVTVNALIAALVLALAAPPEAAKSPPADGALKQPPHSMPADEVRY